MYMHNLVKLCTTTISEIRPLNNQSAIKPLFGLNRMPPDEILQAGPFKKMTLPKISQNCSVLSKCGNTTPEVSILKSVNMCVHIDRLAAPEAMQSAFREKWLSNRFAPPAGSDAGQRWQLMG
ncbi:uncharacterized protein LOC125763160 isoform X1 [Anopheles funestus]|uniref:uncharacterized protein LOC125763160 isoform X1 n=1 Tax=Anopheles funestus TaxID=62324 RepID=UPI0020C69721|nr:uncharacterized protein LOC125763160 isoform X1 [Anopheles funestus]